VVNAALAAGLKPTEVCAYAQNDAYGMGGVKGFRAALPSNPARSRLSPSWTRVLDIPGDNPKRNGIGPVGVYQRDTVSAREGYQSLKQWEAASGNRCRLVATTAVYDPAAAFMDTPATRANPGFSARPRLRRAFPWRPCSRNMASPIRSSPRRSCHRWIRRCRWWWRRARRWAQNLELRESLESYIVGKLFLTIMQAIEGPLTRENFLKAARRQPYDIGGVKVDFTTDNQGSDFVQATVLRDGQFTAITPQELVGLFK
jgi:branched-chain amino acid transport system substrate-binding protein